MQSHKNILILSLSCALLIISAAYILLTAAGDGRLAAAEPDQVLYLQYAKNMATGQPFVFTPGDAPSTGSTTYLYIILLASLYKIGLTGYSFLLASFVLNSLCFMGIIAAVWTIGKRMLPRALPLVMVLTLFSGHTISAVLKQTDIGFFALIALWTFASLVYGRYWMTLLLAVVCAATRPEGFIFSFALLCCGIGAGLLNAAGNPNRRLPAIKMLSAGVLGIAVFLVTLGINHHLTGHTQYMSVISKGYFKIYPLSGAILGTLGDTVELIKGVFMGLQHQGRQFYLFPLLSGIFGFSGILLFRRETEQIRLAECWLVLAVGACLLLIGSSQWAGVSHDRYLGWMFPIWIIYVSIGIFEVSDRVKARYFLPLVSGLFILYQGASVLYIGANAYSSAVDLELEKKFAHELQNRFPSGTVFCSTMGNALNYHAPELRIKNMWGMTTPEFSFPRDGAHLHPAVEKLKHNENLRFDYWLSNNSFNSDRAWMQALVGELILRDNDTGLFDQNTFTVYEADWSALNGGRAPVRLDPGDRALAGSLDIGYIAQEDEFSYRTRSRIKNMSFPTIATVDQLNDADYVEIGRVVIGSEEFVIPDATPEKPLTVIMRTGSRVQGKVYFGSRFASMENVEWNEQLILRVFVDGIEVNIPALPLEEEGFSEVAFTIPGQYITSATPHIELVGDHVSYAFWFYQ